MKRFNTWLVEKKKTRESMPTTPTSAPLRGANQDYSGVGVKRDNADYTISDEKINELSPELIGKVNKARAVGGKPSKTAAASNTLSIAVKKAFLKSKVGAVNEVVAGVGMVRSTPVNMKSTTNVKAKNAPGSAHAMQHAADARRIQLDRQAQQLKDQQKKQRETEIARRKNANNL